MSIKAIRKELGLSQMDFARLFGVHQTAVSQWETGRTSPDTEMAIQIARGTGRSVDEVLGVETRRRAGADESEIEIVMPDDRMAGARIRKGDRVYVRKMDEYKSGSLVLVHRNGEATVRYLTCIGETNYLMDAQTPPAIEKMNAEDQICGIVCGAYVSFR
ncbi:MAG: XRE family transcriptional regulator [Clostridia bacterium]|nr:XRE family transcriptional regulator [Clostridia bacterium]